jgi:hypothetical protein
MVLVPSLYHAGALQLGAQVEMSSLLVSKSIKTNLAQLHPHTTLVYTFEGISINLASF